ncbi:hypothetical protein DFS34DRAFT_630956 [Phlyctochytrium arcticum]|nr:hypothetical protein DFS34DRAFT_630956 [Phlyctochytrium arcticum]
MVLFGNQRDTTATFIGFDAIVSSQPFEIFQLAVPNLLIKTAAVRMIAAFASVVRSVEANNGDPGFLFGESRILVVDALFCLKTFISSRLDKIATTKGNNFSLFASLHITHAHQNPRSGKTPVFSVCPSFQSSPSNMSAHPTPPANPPLKLRSPTNKTFYTLDMKLKVLKSLREGKSKKQVQQEHPHIAPNQIPQWEENEASIEATPYKRHKKTSTPVGPMRGLALVFK